jgi:ribosomal protein S6--L-glutamate ligase
MREVDGSSLSAFVANRAAAAPPEAPRSLPRAPIGAVPRTRVCFMLAGSRGRRTDTVAARVARILKRRGFAVAIDNCEKMLFSPDQVAIAHDLYVLKVSELTMSLAGVLHAGGARLLNPYLSCVATQNKIVASRILSAAGVSTPSCWVTADLARLPAVARERPLVIKPYLGRQGIGVRIVPSPRELRRFPVPERPVLVQEYVEGTGHDLKLYVVMDEVFATRRPTVVDAARPVGQPVQVSPELAELARLCGRALGLGLYGVDVIESPTGPQVVDVNAFPSYRDIPGVAPFVASYIEAYAAGRIALEPPALAPVLEV